MSQHYSDPKREGLTHSLPDVEVFYRTATAIQADDWRDGDGELLPGGWYWWICFPGCQPDSEPNGPFDTEDEAIADMRENTAEDDETED